MASDKTYLGDGVYGAADDFGCLILTTSNGVADTNRIVFEPQVVAALIEYIDHLRSTARIP